MSVSLARYFPTQRPAPPISAAAAASTPTATRTPRREGPPVEVPPPTTSTPELVTTPRSSSTPVGFDVAGAAAWEARRSKSQRAPTPATAVARDGTTSRGSAAGRWSAVNAATATSTSERGAVSEPAPREQPRDRGEHQHAAHHRADEDPLVVAAELPIAHSFIGVGVRSMTWEPTASTGDDAGFEQRGDEVTGRHTDEGREDPEQGVGQPVPHAPCSERSPPRMAIWAAGSRRTTCRS